MKFSIIIISYNTKDLIKNCLDSIFNNLIQEDFEIIVVDNNSSDESLKLLRSYQDKIKLIENKKNLGFGKANNQASKIAEGKYLFFLNSDTLTNDDILKPIFYILEQDEKIGIISPKLILKNGEEQDYAYGEFPKILNLVFKKIKKFKTIADWVSGAAMVIRRDVFEKINGFDDNFFMYFEDIDICKRVKDLGYKIIYFQEVSLVHIGGASQKKLSKTKKNYYISQNYYYKKHHGYLKMTIMKIFRLPYKIIILFLSK